MFMRFRLVLESKEQINVVRETICPRSGWLLKVLVVHFVLGVHVDVTFLNF